MDKFVEEYSQKLKALGIEHEIMEHPAMRDALDVQKFFGVTLAESIPTLIMKADNQFVAILKKGDTKLDSAKLKKILNVQNLRLANDQEFEKVTGVPVGAARVYNPGIKTYIDKSVFEKEYLNGGTGSFTFTFKYKTADLTKIPNGEIVDIAENSSGIKRVYAGIRATGRLHLGNYLGSIRGMIELVSSGGYDCIFQVVDLHTITTPYNPKTLQDSIHDVILDYLGAGLPIDKCHLTIQSLVPEHVLLSYYFSTIYSVNKLEDLPTFKEKRAQHPDYVNLGLLYYPVLMAADILLYKASKVPVGVDQEPHLEVAREIARKFNGLFGDTFPEPTRFVTKGGYVPSLKGAGKMSKSIEGSYISLTDDEETVRRKVAAIPTDTGTAIGKDPEGDVKTIFDLMTLFDEEKTKKYLDEYKQGKIRYSKMKNELCDLINAELKPIQARRAGFEKNPEKVKKIISDGAKYCHSIGSLTLQEVKKKMGIV